MYARFCLVMYRLKQNDMKKLLTLTLLLMALLPAQAQVEEVGGFDFTKKKAEAKAEAERAKKEAEAEAAAAAAREAAEKAEAERKAAAAKSVMTPEEERRIAEQQKKQREKDEARRNRQLQEAMKDSVKWVKNQERMRSWTRRVFGGVQIAPNMNIADNITDHPPFKYGETFGVSISANAGMYFDRRFGARVGLGYSHVKNRVDREWVNAWQHDYIYKGNGFFHFDVFEAYGDFLFDISGVSRSQKYYPMHVMFVLGADFVLSGEKKMDMKTVDPTDENSVKAWNMLQKPKLDADGNPVINDKGEQVMTGEYVTFEHLVRTKATPLVGIRTGFLFDYRVAKNVSVNFELMITTMLNDHYEGIKYAEPIDFLVKPNFGLALWF